MFRIIMAGSVKGVCLCLRHGLDVFRRPSGCGRDTGENPDPGLSFIGGNMNIGDKMLRAYFMVAEEMNSDKSMMEAALRFHENKNCLFFVEARRRDEHQMRPCGIYREKEEK